MIDQFNLRSLAVRKAKNDPPVGAYRDRPESFKLAFQGVKPQARNIEVFDHYLGLEIGQKR